MTSGADPSSRTPLLRWVRATALGWLLGFVLVLVLALAWDMIGGGAQFMVGVGMGAGIGFMQSRAIGDRVKPARQWLWTSTIGVGSPFVLWDLSGLAGLESLFSMPRCVLMGGLFVGMLQWRLLRPRFERAAWWIPACVVGWGLPAGLIALGDSGWAPAPFKLISIVTMFFGGVILGLVTGTALDSITREGE